MSMGIDGKGVRSEINVTPLVDVVLVLLIIFMVITPLLQRGKAVQLPHAQLLSELKRGGDPILLSITADGRKWVEKTEVRIEDLAEVLTGELAARPGTPVVLKADKAVDYKTVREVILEASKTRLPGISLAASPMPVGEDR